MTLGNDDFEVGEDGEFIDELTPGTELMLGQYTIKDFLAAGGFGITYLASDSLGRNVVIKECFPGNFCRRQNHSVMARSRSHQDELKSIIGLFSQEARSLSKAGHPNIVGVHQVFEENNTAYMALDYVEGQDLLEILKEAPESLTPERIQFFLSKILDAISHVHAKGILHRDISPDNILIRSDDEPVLIDFGAARESKDEKASRLLSAMRVVKDGYSPQEFYIAGSDQGPSCDLYSLAASFYHLITGELPPDSQTRLSAFAAGESDPYVPLAKRTKDYSEAFSTALDKAMSVLPKERMQTAKEWQSHMAGVTAEAAAPETDKVTALPKKTSSKMPVFIGGSAIAAAAGAGFFMLSIGNSPDTSVTPSEVSETAELDATTDVEAIDNEPTVTARADIEPSVKASVPVKTASVEDDGPTALPFAMNLAPVDRLAPPKVQPIARPVENMDVALDASTEESADPEFMRLLTQAPRTTVSATAQTQADAVISDGVGASIELGTLDAASVMEVVVPQIPFTLEDTMPGVVASAGSDAPEWLTAGSRIISVDGAGTTTNSDIMTIIQEAAKASPTEATVWLGMDAGLGDASIERALTVTAETQTALLNGLMFVSGSENGEIVTRVSMVPDGSSFRVGDRVVAFMGTGEKVTGKITVKAILERELATGRTSFSFAVERDGEMWVEAFNLAALAQ